MTELVAKDPANAGWHRDLANDQRNLAEVLQAAEDSAGALAKARAALTEITSLTNDPSPNDTHQELARIKRSIGEALRAQGDVAWRPCRGPGGGADHGRVGE